MQNPISFCRRVQLRAVILQFRCFAKKPAAAPGLTMQSQKKRLPVETDAKKLVTQCCGTDYIKGSHPVVLGKDEDYPDWLWKMKLTGRKTMEDYGRDTIEYWENLHYEALYHYNRIRNSRPKPKLRINEKQKEHQLKSIMHRALAFKFGHPGVPVDKQQQYIAREKII